MKCSDSAKGKQLVNFYYKQTKNNFPEFDKGVLPEQYQNHMLHLLEKSFGFRAQWTTEHSSAWKIVVKDEKLLKNNTTLSTHGSGGGLMDRQKQQYNFVNQQLGVVASYAEDILGIPVFATDTFAVGYDMSVEFSSFPAFSKAIASYGLGLEKVEGYEIKKLYLVFE
jgi:hypothetical protein